MPDGVEPGGGGWGGKERAVLTGRVEGARDREAGLAREGGGRLDGGKGRRKWEAMPASGGRQRVGWGTAR